MPFVIGSPPETPARLSVVYISLASLSDSPFIYFFCCISFFKNSTTSSFAS
ncbi:hypothetical protein CRE_15366 [Caenorhabditis remanei]|uniref:Uncharacterized protein n=1 Tax=Caenorhabditis remanei TaxID=31234 RepID=E3MCG7_CAERE|nr:hypothetical protein CRE_15366 [Caenorhabditis remanei]